MRVCVCVFLQMPIPPALITYPPLPPPTPTIPSIHNPLLALAVTANGGTQHILVLACSPMLGMLIERRNISLLYTVEVYRDVIIC